MNNRTEAFKNASRFFIIWCVMTIIVSIGIYGFYMSNDKQTTDGWRVFGALLGTIIIGVPVGIFWMKKLCNLFNIED